MKIEAFNFYVDINGDGRYNGWELWETAKWVYRLPGNLLVEGLGNTPYVSNILGIHASEAAGYASFNNWLAVSSSLLFWLALLILLLSITRYDDSTAKAKMALSTRLQLPDGRTVRPLLENQRVHHRPHRSSHVASHPIK